jgi:hypothetical protein
MWVFFIKKLQINICLFMTIATAQFSITSAKLRGGGFSTIFQLYSSGQFYFVFYEKINYTNM